MNTKLPPLANAQPAATPAPTSRLPPLAAASAPAAQAGVQSPASPSVEGVHQRARYFENLWHHASKHIKDLESRLRRAGHAPPAMPHVEPLKGAGGDFDPNSP